MVGRRLRDGVVNRHPVVGDRIGLAELTTRRDPQVAGVSSWEDCRMAQIITVFRSRLRFDVPEDYGDLAVEMVRLAGEVDGFVEYKVFTAPDGERVSLAVFESAEAEGAWRDHAAHRDAQRRGREAFYERYDVSVCEVVRQRSWSRVIVPSEES